METKTRIKFDVTAESEKRFTIKRSDFQLAVKSGDIKIYSLLQLEQKWIIEGDKYNGRIRKTVDMMLKEKNKTPKFEHTVKHHIKKGMDYEITTDITLQDYNLINNLYKEKEIQSKLRIYVKDCSGKYDKYIITVDCPDDNQDICWVEFESNTVNVENEKFIKPSWIKEINE